LVGLLINPNDDSNVLRMSVDLHGVWHYISGDRTFNLRGP
jgi:hypothetical protein